MRYLVNSREMKALDSYSISTMGIPSMVLMERAALSVVEELRKRRPDPVRTRILCGSGNNGADGLAMARMLTLAGYPVEILVVGNRSHATEEWKSQAVVCENMKIPMEDFSGEITAEELDRYGILVDSLLGTGLSREVQGAYAKVIDAVNASESYTVAVDTPSGISVDTGAVLGHAVRADLTVSFQFGKLGLYLYPGAEYAGECIVRDIGILPQGLEETLPETFTLEPEDLEDLPSRPASSNKGTFGRLLVIAGSRNMAGASLLAGEAAYRAGAGLVRVLAPECNRTILQTGLPEAVLTTYGEEGASDEVLTECCRWATAVVVGPGLGLSECSRSILRRVLSMAGCPVLLDADALNILSQEPELRRYLTESTVLTPHMGELSRLTGRKTGELKADPVAAAKAFLAETPAILVQKDARTLTSQSGHGIFVNICGNSGMSTGGSGDVLAGIIGSLMAQGVTPWEAACYGVLMHAHAGDLAEKEKGSRAMLARDIIRHLGSAAAGNGSVSDGRPGTFRNTTMDH